MLRLESGTETERRVFPPSRRVSAVHGTQRHSRRLSAVNESQRHSRRSFVVNKSQRQKRRPVSSVDGNCPTRRPLRHGKSVSDRKRREASTSKAMAKSGKFESLGETMDEVSSSSISGVAALVTAQRSGSGTEETGTISTIVSAASSESGVVATRGRRPRADPRA